MELGVLRFPHVLFITFTALNQIYRKSENFRCLNIFKWPAGIRKLKARKFFNNENLAGSKGLPDRLGIVDLRSVFSLQSLCNVLYHLVAKRANTISVIFEVNVLRQLLL